MIKRLTIVLLAMLPLLSITSCTEKDVQSAYEYQITHFESSADDMNELKAITDMYADMGVQVGVVFYAKGATYEENDENAIVAFQTKMLAIPDMKIEALGLNPGTTYTISLVKAIASSEDDGILESFPYTQL